MAALNRTADTYIKITQTGMQANRALSDSEMQLAAALQQAAQQRTQIVQLERVAAQERIANARITSQALIADARTEAAAELAERRAGWQMQLQAQRTADAQRLQQQRAAAQQMLQAQRAALQQQAAQERQAQQQQSSSGSGGRGSGIGTYGGVGMTGVYGGLTFGGPAMLALVAGGTLAVGFEKATQAALSFNASLEQNTVAFTTMLGSGQAALQYLEQLRQFALTTPFEFQDLEEAAKRMMALGFSAQQVIPILTDIGNAVAALGGGQEKIDRIVLALGQMQGKGRIMAQEMNQLAEAGIPAWKILADALGTTQAEAMKAAEAGKVSADTFITAFSAFSKANYGGLMEAQSHTFLGALSNIKDAVQQFLGTTLKPLTDRMRDVAVRLGDMAANGDLEKWAQKGQQVITSLIGTFKELLAIVLSVARAVGGVFGINIPGIELPHVPTATPKQQQQGQSDVLANTVAQAAQKAAPSAAAWNAAIKQLAEDSLEKIADQLDDIHDKQAALADQVSDIHDKYDAILTPLQKQLDAVNKLSAAEKERQQRLDELTGQEIKIKLAMPDTSGIDKAIDDLERKKEDLGRFDPTDYDNLIRPLQAQSEAYSKTIQGLQDQIADLGDADTAALDKNIKNLQKQIGDIGKDRTIERRIQDLQALLSKPPPDTSNLNNQMLSLAAQMAGANPQIQGALISQYGELSRQKVSILSADQQARLGAQTELEQLQEKQRIQQRTDEDHKDSLQKQLEQQQEQRDTVIATHDAAVKGLQKQIAEQDKLKRAVDEQARVWSKAKQDAQDAFQKQVQGIDDQITKLKRNKDDLLAPSQAALKQIDSEKSILSLQQQQDDIRRKMLAQPIQEQIEAAKAAMDAELDPLQKQSAELDKQVRALDSQKRYWDDIAQSIKKAEDAAKKASPQQAPNSGRAPDNLADNPYGADFAVGKVPQEQGINKVAEAIDNFTKKLEILHKFIDDKLVPVFTLWGKWLAFDLAVLNLLATSVEKVLDWTGKLYKLMEPGLNEAFKTLKENGQRLSDWMGTIFKPLLGDVRDIFEALLPILRDLAPVVKTQLAVAFVELEIALAAAEVVLKEIGFYADTILKPIVVGLADIFTTDLVGSLNLLHDLLNDHVIPKLTELRDKIEKEVTPIVQAVGEQIDTFKDKLIGLKNWIASNWEEVGTKLASPFTSAWDKIKDFFGKLYEGIKWLAEHFGLKTPAAPSFVNIGSGSSGGNIPAGTVTSPPSVGTFAPIPTGGSARNSATGRLNAGEGHWSWVGEQGPEMMYVPKGASILPNGLSRDLSNLPGYADGFNVDSVFGPLGAVVAGSAGKFADALTDKLPSFTLPGVDGGSAAMLKEISTGLRNWLENAPGNIARQVVSGVAGALASGPYIPGTPGDYSGQWQYPLAGGRYPITQKAFSGAYSHANLGAYDLGAPMGTPVLAASNGTVIAAQPGYNYGYGQMVEIQHGRDWQTLYGHLLQLATSVGSMVNMGQQIGVSGGAQGQPNAGNSTGAHLHFEMHHPNGVQFDPSRVMSFGKGGITVGGSPRYAVVGDGPPGQREFHMPEPELRNVIREEARPNVTFQKGAIQVDKDGNATVDQSKISFDSQFTAQQYASGRIPRR